jgi:hypothetical protein
LRLRTLADGGEGKPRRATQAAGKERWGRRLTLGVGAAERGRSERLEMRRKTRGGGWVEHGEFGGFGGIIYINGTDTGCSSRVGGTR